MGPPVGNVWLLIASVKISVLTTKANIMIAVLAVSDVSGNIGFVQAF